MHKVAVLIDADNIPASLAPDVFKRAAETGIPIVRRIFGRPSAMSDWQDAAHREACELRPQDKVGPAKNGTDIALAINAMDILHEGVVDAFCIVSNDRDFLPLAIRLRASGKLVHAICRTGSEQYASAFDNVFELDLLPIVAAFRKIISDGEDEFALARAGTLLRMVAPDLVPPPGKGRLRKALEQTGQFDFPGEGAAIRVRLKA